MQTKVKYVPLSFLSFYSYFLQYSVVTEILTKLCAAVKMSVKEMGQATFHKSNERQRKFLIKHGETMLLLT